MPDTIVQTEIIVDYLGKLVATELSPGVSMVHYLTDCCNASAKGGEHGVVCRACYREIDPEMGMAWLADDQDAWYDWSARMGYDNDQADKSRTLALDNGA